MSQKPLNKPTKTLGILGGGQLGRLSALAAARLGIAVHIFCPEPDCPASFVAAQTTVADYTDKVALRRFAKDVDVLSYEFENIPVETIRFLKTIKPVYPDDYLLEISQHRWKEKEFLNAIGIPTAKWARATRPDHVQSAIKELGLTRCILKTTRFGYDGKGQARLDKGDDVNAIWATLKSNEIIVEELIDFKCEISCVIARDQFGKTAVYDPVLNQHKNHILSRSTAPAPITPALAKKAIQYTKKLADHVDLIGVLALEFFVTAEEKLLANEIAPRTHNSGHWTIDACAVSQFENHVRTVCGLPVGPTTRHSDAVMLNLIGADVASADSYLSKANACLHLYGKREIREGRKMGHVTLLKPKSP